MKPAQKSSGGVFDIPKLVARQKELLELSTKQEFWDRPETAQGVLKEQDQLKGQVQGYQRLRDRLEEARVFFQMAEEEGADDSEAAREATAALAAARIELEKHELQVMLGGSTIVSVR